jgi:ketosteroid isomerase-like protein
MEDSMTTNKPAAIVQRMFSAFEERDLEKLLATVHPDSQWTYVGANPRPAKGTYVGRNNVRRFFERILANLDITSHEAREFVTENDTVVVFGYESGTVNATGEPFRNEWVQKYVVRDGLITEMEEYNIQIPRT